jgi:hypothetical protein
MVPRSRPRRTSASSHAAGPHCWIVEVSRSWSNNFRKLKNRYEMATANILALYHPASIALRRCHSKTGKNTIYG